jgi:hypothetical protein
VAAIVLSNCMQKETPVLTFHNSIPDILREVVERKEEFIIPDRVERVINTFVLKRSNY